VTAHVLDRLSAYLDDETTLAERRSIDAHVRECRECAERLSELAAVDAAARVLPLEAPEGYFDTFAERVRQRLGSVTETPRAWRPPVWTWAVAAALFAAVLVPALLIQSRSSPARYAERASSQAGRAAEPAAPAPAPTTSVPALKRDELKAQKAAKPAPAVGGSLDARAAEQPASTPPATTLAARRESEETDRLRGLGYVGAAQAPARTAPDAAAANPGFASAAPGAAAPPANRAAARLTKSKDEAGLDVGRADSQEAAKLRAADDAEYGHLASADAPATAPEARALRARWLAFVRLHPESSRVDEARVRAIEAAAAAFRLGGERADLVLLRHDAEAYLARSDAAQADRVRELLRDVPE